MSEIKSIQNTFLIDSEENKNKCIDYIKSLNVFEKKCLMIVDKEKQKTIKQCAKFHCLLKEFIKTGQNYSNDKEFDNWQIGYWKYKIKKDANFYDTKKGCLFPKIKQEMIWNELKKLDRQNLVKEIIDAMTMNVKSISQATTIEIGVLIDTLIKYIVEYLYQDWILSNKELTKAVEEKYNNLMNSDIIQLNNFNDYLLNIMNAKLKFVNSAGVYHLDNEAIRIAGVDDEYYEEEYEEE